MSIIDNNTDILVLRTTVTNTDIIGVTSNVKVIVAGIFDDGSSSFTNVQHLVIDYSDEITNISSKVDELLVKIDNLTDNIASMTTMAANTGIKVIEAYSWIGAASQAYFSLPYTLVAYNKQAVANTEDKTYPFPQEAYNNYVNSSANLVFLRDIASNIPPFTTNTGGGIIWALVAMGDEPPPNAVPNTVWYNTSNTPAGGQMYILYDDGDSVQWVAT